jgi:hypothetical protein
LPLPAPVPGGGQGGTANRLRAWAQRIDREAVKELTP